MKIEKWGFLLAYTMYLIFCIIYLICYKDSPSIDTMIFAITITSTLFSISDLLFTKFHIDKKEREALTSLYSLTEFAESYYKKLIKDKFGEQAEKIVTHLMDIFSDSELVQLFSGNFTEVEVEFFSQKIREESNDELTKFVDNLLTSDLSDSVNKEENVENTYELLSGREKSEKLFYCFASIIAALGLVALLVVLTIRIKPIPYLTNIFTVIAFLSVILTILLKEYYRSNSIKSVNEQKKELLNDLKERKQTEPK